MPTYKRKKIKTQTDYWKKKKEKVGTIAIMPIE